MLCNLCLNKVEIFDFFYTEIKMKQKYEYPILEVYQTKRVVNVAEPDTEFSVHRLIERSVYPKPVLPVQNTISFKLRMLVLVIILILLALLTVSIVAFGISSIKKSILLF
jgi:hypothetical protein